MTDKTLGEVAFDAAKQCPALMLDTLAPWEQQRPDVREAWQAAAEAVSEMVIQKWSTTLWPLRGTVIEAARVYVHGYRKPYQASTGHAHQALMKAIEALEAAEKGDE